MPCGPPAIDSLRRESRKRVGDRTVAALGLVLVQLGRRRGRVPKSGLQLRRGCSRLGRERRAGVAEIVPAQIRPAGGLLGLEEVGRHPRVPQMTACGGREEQGVGERPT